jgi:ribosomal protein S18 acetylase RimI-like enzyme
MQIAEIRSADDPLFGQVVALYETSFPLAEREPTERLAKDVEGQGADRFRIFAVHREGKLLGFVRWRHLPETRAQFVVHIAVVANSRESGIGRMLLQAVAQENPGLPMIFEVEREEDAADERDRVVRRTRLNWFRRAGSLLLTKDYTQPALHEETGPVPLCLLRLGPIREPEDTIRSFYQEVWGIDGQHEYVEKALAGVPR